MPLITPPLVYSLWITHQRVGGVGWIKHEDKSPEQVILNNQSWFEKHTNSKLYFWLLNLKIPKKEFAMKS